MLTLAFGEWRDTVTCLASVFAHTDEHVRVVLVDNGSSDDSIDRVLEWAASERALPLTSAEDSPIALPQAKPPITVARYTRAQVEAGTGEVTDARLTVIENGANLGFGAGNNVGLRHILDRGDAAFVWLLNNDAVAAPGALTAMESIMLDDDSIGICGSTVLHYGDPTRVQVLGGLRYLPAIGLAMRLGRDRRADDLLGRAYAERRLDLVYGASMLIRREVLETVGLLTEETFLYNEELDLALRARPRFKLAWAPDSVVYHKGGATIGSSGGIVKRSAYSAYHLARSTMWITGRHYRWALPTVCLAQMGQAAIRAAYGNPQAAKAIMRAVLGRPLTAE